MNYLGKTYIMRHWGVVVYSFEEHFVEQKLNSALRGTRHMTQGTITFPWGKMIAPPRELLLIL